MHRRLQAHRHNNTYISFKQRLRDMEWNDCWLLYASLSPPGPVHYEPFSPTPPTFSLRKEVIQPQVLLRLPCYDFTPIMNHTLGLLTLGLLVQSTFVM
jgi:hypothetical protein